MLNQAIGGLLPAAVAVALSPIPIVGIILVLDSPRGRGTGPAFAAGWVLGLAVVSTVVVVVIGNAGDATDNVSTGVDWVTAEIGVLFLALAAQQWTKRPRRGEAPKTPSWMASIDSLSPAKAGLLGAALSGANPKNLALMLAASAAIVEEGLDEVDTVLAVAAFVVIGSVTVVGAVVCFVVAPKRSARLLAVAKQFMSENNATIMMVVLLLLGAKFLGDGLAGV